MIENAKIGARSQNKIDLTKFLLMGITVKCQVPKNSLARGFFSHELIELNDATQIVLLLKFFFFLFGLGVHSIMSLWDKFLSANKSSSSKNPQALRNLRIHINSCLLKNPLPAHRSLEVELLKISVLTLILLKND